MSQNKFRIRRMEKRDAEAVSRMERQIFSQPWSSQGFLDALSCDNVIFLVAETEKELAGYCGMYCAMDEGEITNVAVAVELRNRGLGRMLVEELLRAEKEAGIHRVILEVRVSNDSAIRLYEKLGFVVCGVRRGFYEKPKEDGYVMTLSQ